jgi:hypothetical protein
LLRCTILTKRAHPVREDKENLMNPANRTHAPKLLPWLAKKAGIDMRRAEVLWHDACRYAAQHATPETSDYFKIAIDRLLQLVAAESLRADAASFGWRPWARAQQRLWSALVHLMELGSVATARSLRQITAQA